MWKSSKNQSGFTILEVMTAIVVLTIGIIVVARIFPLALKVGKSSEQATVAINLAQAKIEEMFYLGFDNIPIDPVIPIEAKTRLSIDPQNPFYDYQRQTMAEYVDGDLNHSATATEIKKVTVTVYWLSPVLGTEKNQNLIILIGKK